MKSPEKLKILIVAESIDIEDSSGTKGRVALIHNLHKIGYDLKVYHYSRKKIKLEGIECIAIKEKRRSFFFYLSRLERYARNYLKLRLHKPLEKLFGFSFTLFNDRDSIICALRKENDFEPDLVLTLSKGGSFRPHHALLQMPEWHSKWLAYIHDPYPAHLYPRPFAWVEPGYYKKWKFVKDVSVKAAYSAFPSQLLMEWMASYFPNFQKTGIVIPHQINQNQTEVEKLPAFFDENKFNLLHAGTLLGPRDPIPLVTAYEKFLRNNPEVKNDAQLIFIGNSEHFSSQLETFFDKLPESTFIVNPYTEHKKVLQMQKQACVNIILEAKSEISPFLPGKFPHCVLADKPILLLGPYFSESRRLLGDSYTYWCEVDDIENIVRLLEDLYQLWKIDSNGLKLNRPDLEDYLSENYLSETINGLTGMR